MNINIYQKYKVEIEHECSYLSEENSTKYDNIFVTNKDKEIVVISGDDLLIELSKRLNDMYLSEFIVNKYLLTFEYFNCNNGENSVVSYRIIEDIYEDDK